MLISPLAHIKFLPFIQMKTHTYTHNKKSTTKTEANSKEQQQPQKTKNYLLKTKQVFRHIA